MDFVLSTVYPPRAYKTSLACCSRYKVNIEEWVDISDSKSEMSLISLVTGESGMMRVNLSVKVKYLAFAACLFTQR